MYNNFDELIAGIHHSGNVISDSEPAIIIDGYKRTLTPEAGFNTQIAVTNDYNTNEITFKCDKIVDGHDLSACNNKAIKWHNSASNMVGSDKLEMVKSDDSTFTLTWRVPPEAATRAGTLRIAICFCDVDDDKIIYKWNSLVYDGLQVAQGMDNIAITGVPLSSIIDVNVYNRTITLPTDYNTTIGIQGAYGTAKLTFRVNRFFNDWDFTEENTMGQILYIAGEEQKKTTLPNDYRIIESLSGNIKDDWIEFDWEVPTEIFEQSGNFSIAIGFASVERNKIWRSKDLDVLEIEPSSFSNGQIPESSEEGWLFISQEELTQLLNEEYKEV